MLTRNKANRIGTECRTLATIGSMLDRFQNLILYFLAGVGAVGTVVAVLFIIWAYQCP